MGATDSQIAMWRGAIALLWANPSVDQAERNRLVEYFKDNVYLTDAQRAQLTRDMTNKIELKDVWGAITDTEDREHLIDIAPSLFSAHGTPTPEEKALYDKMFADQMATVDMPALKKQIGDLKAQIPAEMAALEDEYKHDFDNFGAAGRMIYHFDHWLDNLV